MDRKKRAVTSFVGAGFSALGAIIIFSVVSQGESSWKYAFDDDFRTIVSILKLLGWLCVLFTVVDLIQGFAYSMVEEKNNEPETSERREQRDSCGETTGTVRCPCCGYLMSNSAEKCPHCGVLVVRSRQDDLQTSGSGSVEQEIGNRGMKKCIFCGETMTEKQTFCGACGRRQD